MFLWFSGSFVPHRLFVSWVAKPFCEPGQGRYLPASQFCPASVIAAACPEPCGPPRLHCDVPLPPLLQKAVEAVLTQGISMHIYGGIPLEAKVLSENLSGGVNL